MTENEFAARLAQIDQEHAGGRERADAHRDQELAKLFLEAEESGQGQEWIADRMRKNQAWVSRRMLFGRFLAFMPTGIKRDQLTEWRFRDYWQRTEGTEAQRFAQVLELIEHSIPQGKGATTNKPGIRRAIVQAMADRQWYTSEQLLRLIAADLPGVTMKQVLSAIGVLRLSNRLEIKRLGRASQYRLAEPERNPVARVYRNVEPLLDELDQIANFHGADTRQALTILKMVAVKLRRVFTSLIDTL